MSKNASQSVVLAPKSIDVYVEYKEQHLMLLYSTSQLGALFVQGANIWMTSPDEKHDPDLLLTPEDYRLVAERLIL